MEKVALKHLIDVAAGRAPADLLISNCILAEVYSGDFLPADIAVTGGLIAGVHPAAPAPRGKSAVDSAPVYEARCTIDAGGAYALPGLIDSHIHIESSYVTPEEISRLLVPHGTSTIISDPHEIVNVAGEAGFRYMLAAAQKAKLDIKFMLPSCVPSTPFQSAGAILDADDMVRIIDGGGVFGFGEMMDYRGVVTGDAEVLAKIALAQNRDFLIDGHAPGLHSLPLQAYAASGIHTDHECATPEELAARIRSGMYVMLRQGSACHDLRRLLSGVTAENSRRCVLCSDDRHPETIFEKGHLEEHLRICVEFGLPPMTAIRMATLNAAECFRLRDRGAIAPGLRADIALVRDLKRFEVQKVFLKGELIAQNGAYAFPVPRVDDRAVRSSFHVANFSAGRLVLPLKTGRVHLMDMEPGSIVTKNSIAAVVGDAEGNFCYTPGTDIVKIAVIERHHATGNVGIGLIRGYGIRRGAVAISIAHDSHNIMALGVNDTDMVAAVEALIAQGGGMALALDAKIIAALPLPIGGIMSDQGGEWVARTLAAVHAAAHTQLGIPDDIEPLMSLSFMALPVIPEIKITDRGLFDVTAFKFIEIDA